jgi:hypothetical protein
VSPLYDRWVNPLFWTPSMRARALSAAQLDEPRLDTLDVGAGRLHITHEDGTEADIGPGDAYVIEPGHDGWVVGDETFVGFEFEARSAEEYARS